MEYTFINYVTMINETKLYNSIVDYEKLFNEIESNDIILLKRLTSYYYKYFIENSYSSILLEPIKKIDGVAIRIHFYINNTYSYVVQTSNTKIGINVSLSPYDYINPENYNILQNIYLTGCDLNNENIFKNYIYNILFYTKVIINDFKFHPMLSYLNHVDDIQNLLEIKDAILQLFGENVECSVCLEKTITKTICNHGLCQICYSNLVIKSCPMCRQTLLTDEIMEEYNDLF